MALLDRTPGIIAETKAHPSTESLCRFWGGTVAVSPICPLHGDRGRVREAARALDATDEILFPWKRGKLWTSHIGELYVGSRLREGSQGQPAELRRRAEALEDRFAWSSPLGVPFGTWVSISGGSPGMSLPTSGEVIVQEGRRGQSIVISSAPTGIFCVEEDSSMAEIRASQRITPFLMFKEGGEAAVSCYVSLFKNSKIHSMSRNGSALAHASFELDGQKFLAMDGGAYFHFAQGISLFVDCETQEEVDRLWEKLSEGGEKLQCGWVKDRWGLSWQIVPAILGRLMGDKDPVKAKRVVEAMLKMKKLIIKDLQEAYGM